VLIVGTEAAALHLLVEWQCALEAPVRARSSCCDARPRGVALPRTLAGGLGRMLTLKNHLHADALCPCPTNDTMSMARRSFDL